MCWCICNSVIHHFKSDYDAVKYRYKMPWFTPNKYGGDRNQWWYQGISKKLVWQEEVVKLAYANAAEGNYFVRDFDQGLYDELNKFLQSQTYEFEKDLKKLKERNDNFDYWLLPEEGSSPPIMNTYQANNKTRVIMNLMTGFADRYNKINKDTLAWPSKYKELKKHEQFLSQWINITKMKKLAYKVFTS